MSVADDRIRTPRRSSRERRLTEKGEEIMQAAASKYAKNFDDKYSQWKSYAKAARMHLKDPAAEREIEECIKKVNAVHSDLLSCYEETKLVRLPTQDEVRRLDCVTQVTQDINKVVAQLKVMFSIRLCCNKLCSTRSWQN